MKKTLSILLSLVMLLSLCACGNTNTADKRMSVSGYTESASVYNDMMMADCAEEVDYDGAGLSMSRAAPTAAAGKDAADGTEAAENDPEKIIYSADVTVETTAFDDSLPLVNELVVRYGGWIESSSVNGANFYDISRGNTRSRSASFTLRIPGDRFDELMNSLSELGNVPYTHVYTENVTAQYYDTQSRMTAYKTQEARLLEMMEVAESVEDIILLEERLTELRYQIESLQSTLLNWDRRVSYSTVYLQLNEVREYTVETPAQLSYGERLSRAFHDGIASVSRFFKDFLLWFVEALPTLVILTVLLVILIPLVRKLHRRGKARRAERKATMAEKKQKTE